MQTSAEIRKKLALLIGSLICRCLREARMIPHVLNRDEVIGILVGDPLLYEKLVQDEHSENAELSKEDLTIKLDVAKDLEQLDRLKAFERSYWDGPEVDLSPIMDLTNQLTRTFAVYLGNAATLFDRTFEDFMSKFRQSLQRAGMTLQTVDFTLEDAAILETNALSYLSAGEFLQAFTYDRLLSSQIMMKQVVTLPGVGISVREDLIRQGLNDPNLSSALVKFALRVSYVSQASWEDLFKIVVRRVYEEPGLFPSARLLELIEQDVVFSCNLLCKSYAEIRTWSPLQRRSAIETSLRKVRNWQ